MTKNLSNSATVWPGTSGLESLLSEIKLDVSRGRVAVTPSRQQYAYLLSNEYVDENTGNSNLLNKQITRMSVYEHNV